MGVLKYNEPGQEVLMERREYEMMFAVEDGHWWYTGMRRISTRLITHLFPHRRDLVVLDAGGGTGAVLRDLASFGQVTGMDVSTLALGFCQRRGLRRLDQATVTSLPYRRASFDLVTSFDVLYHQAVSNYGAALSEFQRVLKPGGRLFLRLPAYNWLRGRHDRAIHTARRFTARELGHALATAGLEVEKLSYANTLLFPLALGKRLIEAWLPPQQGSDIHPNAAWQDTLLRLFLYWEARWLERHTLPYGLTVIAIAKKG